MNSTSPPTVSREEYDALVALNADLQKQVTALNSELERLLAMLRLSQHARFGRSSEKKTISPDQLSFFNEAEMESDTESLEEPTPETVTIRRPKKKGKRDADLSVLPQEIVEHKLAESERLCPTCDTVMDACGVTDHYQLIYVPATLKSVNHRQHAYVCPYCKSHGDKAEVRRAPMPAPLLPKSLVSPSLLAHIVTEKFDKAVPLYRLERTFADKRFHLPRQSMARWLIQVHNEYLNGFRDALHAQLQTATHLHADETEVQVLKEPNREPTKKSWMWVYRTGRGSPPIVLYDYQQTRGGQHAVTFLDRFKGTLQTDGYAGYNALPGAVIRAGCLAHARRRFIETERALPKATLPEQRVDLDMVLASIRQLYAIEEKVAESAAKAYMEPTAFEQLLQEARQLQSRPVFDRLFRRLKELKQTVLPHSTFGKAIHYAL